MLQFHETLERFFQKNFHDEIQRLPTEPSDTSVGSPNGYVQTRAVRSPTSTARSAREAPRTVTSSPSSKRGSRNAMAVGRGAPSLYAPSHLSQPYSDVSTVHAQPHAQTPLQKNLAHLVRHGMNGMSLVTEGVDSSPPATTPHHARNSSSSDPALIVGNPTGSQLGYSVSTLSRNASLAGAANSIGERLSRFGSILRRER
jgi:dedicator of cytokinesis protein 3